jgi:hypothetical protein
VFEASVQMVFQAKTHDVLKMAVINMSINSEKSFKNDFDNLHEVFRKGNAFDKLNLPS